MRLSLPYGRHIAYIDRSRQAKEMKKNEVIIKNKLSSNLIMSIGGIFSTLLGVFLLLNPNEMDKGGLPNWILGVFFLRTNCFFYIIRLSSNKNQKR